MEAALSSERGPLLKMAEEVEELVVVELRVKIDEIVDCAQEADGIEDAETQSPDGFGVGGTRGVGGDPLRERALASDARAPNRITNRKYRAYVCRQCQRVEGTR